MLAPDHTLMTTPTLTTADLADELGRTVTWVQDNWRDLQKTRKMPKPLHDRPPMVWSRAQIYAWLDRDLTPGERAAAAAFRAAHDAARRVTIATSDDIVEARARLEARFVRKETA